MNEFSTNCVWIELRAALEEKIDWDAAFELAKNAVSRGQKIFWELNLGLDAPFFPIEDEMVFQGLAAALKHFSEGVYPYFEEASLGAALYRGSLDLSGRFLSTPRQEENYAAWQSETAVDPRYFFLDSYAAYFQMLAHKLPDALPIFLLFDAAGLVRADALLLLSKERFQYFELAAKGVGCSSWCLEWGEGQIGEKKSVSIGVVMPQRCDPSEFEARLQEMDALGAPYRVVSEAFLTEQWDGLEAIVAGPLSSRGKRMLKGFAAAGGVVMSWEEFRGRGIRTPDLLVPNQPR